MRVAKYNTGWNAILEVWDNDEGLDMNLIIFPAHVPELLLLIAGSIEELVAWGITQEWMVRMRQESDLGDIYLIMKH